MSELTDTVIRRLLETRYSFDVPSRYIRLMAAEIVEHRNYVSEDGKLFRAAPDLLEALEPFAKFACDEPCGCNNCRARAAVAKAKGK